MKPLEPTFTRDGFGFRSTNQIAAKLCPRWDRCAVNNCPLDPHASHPLDKERTCDMEKNVRVRIASQFPGKNASGGLTPNEAAAARRYAQSSSFTRLAGLERLKVAREKLATQKGVIR